jgi:hypothetical protein
MTGRSLEKKPAPMLPVVNHKYTNQKDFQRPMNDILTPRSQYERENMPDTYIYADLGSVLPQISTNNSNSPMRESNISKILKKTQSSEIRIKTPIENELYTNYKWNEEKHIRNSMILPSDETKLI